MDLYPALVKATVGRDCQLGEQWEPANVFNNLQGNHGGNQEGTGGNHFSARFSTLINPCLGSPVVPFVVPS
jgi:hypothetical protein